MANLYCVGGDVKHSLLTPFDVWLIFPFKLLDFGFVILITGILFYSKL